MRLTLIAVGRIGTGPNNPELALFEHYASRLNWTLAVKEVDDKKKRRGPELKRAEAALLSQAIPKGAKVVALDERGRNFTSRQFAESLNDWREVGFHDIAFLIGGASGLDDGLRQRADLVLSLGSLTWPHMLVRGLLVEQLFRAQCILSGHPYHRD